MKLDLFPSASASARPPPSPAEASTGDATPDATGKPLTKAPAPASPNADDRSTTFRPVTGGTELQSGEKLLVEAYAAIWVILFAVVLFSWRKQRSVDARIDVLEGTIARAREAVSLGNPVGVPQTPPVSLGNPVGVPQTPPVSLGNPVGVPQTPPAEDKARAGGAD